MALPLLGVFVLEWESAPRMDGVAWAVLSGAVTSGLGYAVWYRVLPSLSASRAGIVQLLVPPLAALGGIIWLSEPLTWRFALASALILSGIGLATWRARDAAELLT
jgi:drug/metabolite transporter (DMT)-like permease